MPHLRSTGEEKGDEPHSNTVPSWKRFLTAALKQEAYKASKVPAAKLGFLLEDAIFFIDYWGGYIQLALEELLMKRFIIALMIVCMAIGLASCYQYPPPPPLFGGDDPGIVMITTYQQMKSLLSGSGSGTYYLDNVPFAADAEAVDVNGKKNILGSVNVNGAGTQVVAKGIAAKADPSETSEPIVIFRIANSAEVSFSDFTAKVKASVTENVEIISVDAGKLSASNVEVETEAGSTASVVGIAIGTNATAENISVVNSASASITIAKGNENALDIVESIRQENPGSAGIPEISTQYDAADFKGLQDALTAYGKARLTEDINASATIALSGTDKDFSIDLNGHSITRDKGCVIVISGSTAVLNDSVGTGKVITSTDSGSGACIQVIEEGSLIINGGHYEGEFAIAAGEAGNKQYSNGHVTINNATAYSREFALPVWGTSSLIVYDGTFEAFDNAVVGTNGSPYLSECSYDIDILGGTFNGGITTPEYIACGIYACNNGSVTVDDAVFNITDGVGILLRGGSLDIGSGVTININGSLTSGKVGDSKIVVSNKPLVVDEDSKYPAMGSISVQNDSQYELVDANNNPWPAGTN